MAFWNNQDLSFGGDSYNPTQSNILGQSLAPITPQGDLAASDPQYDNRTPEQIKQDAQTANRVATNSADENDNFITSANGNKYEKVNNSDWHNALTAASEYMTNYFASGGNVGAAAKAAGSALYANEAKAHRLEQVETLEKEGMNPLDIQAWINSGNKQDLTRNKGSWTSGGNGTMFNTLTGETRNIPGATAPNISAVNTGDQVVFYDKKTGQIVNQQSTGIKPGTFQAAGASGGSDGLDEPETQTDENGNTYYWQPFANGKGGKWTPVSATVQKQLNERTAAATPTASESMMNSDLSNLSTAINNNQVGAFTGQVVGRSQTMQDLASGVAAPETRAAYQSAQRVQGYMQNQGVGAAKSMGLSGINTIEEAKRAFASMPQLDFTSPEHLKASVDQIQSYVSNYNAQSRREKGVNPQKQAAPQGVTHVERGPDGKLRIVQG
ncbi:hypothetical protein P8G24_004692 [Salmonella enterica]|nr:hypothetical protein [Salmonella enterica]